MAFNDTLFQLGMDLTRSSPAHEEDIVAGSARVESGDSTILVAERPATGTGVHFAGSHLVVDLIGAKRLEDMKYVEATVRRCARAIGSPLVSAKLARTSAKGVASFDVFVSDAADAYDAVDSLRAAFAAREAVLKTCRPCASLPAHVVQIATRRAPSRVARTPRKKAA